MMLKLFKKRVNMFILSELFWPFLVSKLEVEHVLSSLNNVTSLLTRTESICKLNKISLI